MQQFQPRHSGMSMPTASSHWTSDLRSSVTMQKALKKLVSQPVKKTRTCFRLQLRFEILSIAEVICSLYVALCGRWLDTEAAVTVHKRDKPPLQIFEPPSFCSAQQLATVGYPLQLLYKVIHLQMLNYSYIDFCHFLFN